MTIRKTVAVCAATLTCVLTGSGSPAMAAAPIGRFVQAPALATRAMPFDFNGDGFAEGVVGSDGEDIGSAVNAGSFYVFPNQSGILTGTGSLAYSQDTPNVPGGAETDDYFGSVQVSGDFNDDGYADLAVSSPKEDLASKDAGSVTVFYGSATGLTTAGSFALDGPGIPGNEFGASLAVGDFNGDGVDDLAVGAPGSSAVYEYDTVAAGAAPTREIDRGAPGLGQPDTDSLFGWSVSAGDVNGDGYADLAIGSPWDYDDHGWNAGAVFIVYGGTSGLDHGGPAPQRWTLDSAGIKGTEGKFTPGTDQPDDFGWSVALADFNGDGRADLAASAPGALVTNTSKHQDAGTVSILFSDGTGISDADMLLNEDTAGIPGSPGTGDAFGATLAAGDANGDGKADLAVYADSHMVEVIPGGGTGGLDTAGTVNWTQASPGVPGSDETGDAWGQSLRFESLQGAGPQALLVGAPGENSAAGAVTVLYASAGGLTSIGSTAFSQDSAGVPGGAESGDDMGSF